VTRTGGRDASATATEFAVWSLASRNRATLMRWTISYCSSAWAKAATAIKAAGAKEVSPNENTESLQRICRPREQLARSGLLLPTFGERDHMAEELVSNIVRDVPRDAMQSQQNLIPVVCALLTVVRGVEHAAGEPHPLFFGQCRGQRRGVRQACPEGRKNSWDMCLDFQGDDRSPETILSSLRCRCLQERQDDRVSTAPI
jgi:hypothetical protein